MVTGEQVDKPAWSIVPYPERTVFKKVRVRQDGHIDTLLRYIGDKECIALLGPPFSEKTLLLRDIEEELLDTDAFQPIYIDLWNTVSDDEATLFASIARLMAHVPGANLIYPDQQLTSGLAFQNHLDACLQAQDRHLVLLIDHLQALPHYLVHSLLNALRASYMSHELDATRHLVAVVTGGTILAGLSSDSPTSPFNIAKPVVVTPLTREQSLALAQSAFEIRKTQVSEAALEKIWDWVGGDYHLIPRICAWSADAVRGYRRPQVTTVVVERSVDRLKQTDRTQAPIREAIRLIEEDPGSVLDVLDVLRLGALPRNRARQEVARTGTDRLQLSGALVLQDNQFYFKNRIYRDAVANHFTPGRVGHVLRIAGLWQEAIDYLTPHLTAKTQRSARPQLLEAIVQAIYASDDVDHAYQMLVKGIALGFNRHRVFVYRADPAAGKLRLVSPGYGSPQQLEDIDLADRERLEVQTFLRGDHALPVNAETDEVRLITALMARQRPLGVLVIPGYAVALDPRHEPPRDLPPLLHFVNHAAEAIDNVALRAASRKIGRAVLNAKTWQTTIDAVLAAVAEGLGCTNATLYLLDGDGKTLRLAASAAQMRKAVEPAAAHPPMPDTHPAAVCCSEARIMTSLSAGLIREGSLREKPGIQNGAHVYLPLQAGEIRLGALEVAFAANPKASFVDDGQRKVLDLADQVAIAVHNLQLLRRTDEALARRVNELEKLRSVSLAVSSTLDLEAVLSRIITDVRELFPGTEATIWQADPQGQELTVLHTSLMADGYPDRRLTLESITGKAVTSRRRQIQTDLQALTWAPVHRQALRLGLKGMIAMPLVSHDRVLGTINLYTTAANPIDVIDEELLDAFAAQATVAIDNARQYRELEAARLKLEDTSERELMDIANALFHRIGNTVGDVPYQLQQIQVAGRRDDDIAARIEHVNLRIRSLEELLDPLRALIQLRDLAMAPIDLRLVVEEAEASALACQGLDYVVDLPVAPVWVVGHHVLLRDAVQSVLENACEATGGHSEVGIRLAQVAQHAVLTVVDGGPGIPEDILPRIFEPGFSTKAAPAYGRGQGLFTARAILRKHRGAIEAHSQRDQGATITITLPVSSPASPDTTPK